MNLINSKTQEIAPAHRIGTDEDGRVLYTFVEGWVPEFAYECDEDGNWVYLEQITDACVGAAKKAAASFAEEFPGQQLDPTKTDWDATAWQIDAPGISKVIGDQVIPESAWDVYQRTLVAEIARLAKGRPARQVSVDNGQHLQAAEDLEDELLDKHWEALVHAMDDAAREKVHGELAPTTPRAFLARYLEIAPHDLVIG